MPAMSDAATHVEPADPRHPFRLWRGLAIALIVAAALVPLDLWISQTIRQWRPTGDLRRELELIQQFGSPTTIALATLLIWRLDPRRLRRVLDWLAAAGVTWAVVFALKITLGRPRPKFDEHLTFLGPWNTHVVEEGGPPRHAWEISAPDITEIWSMPSSHTAFAFVAAVFLGRLYPRLWPLVLALACVVGFCRVLFRAHFASDVVVGGVLAAVITSYAYTHGWGVRGLDWLWRTLVNRNAAPAWPTLRDRTKT